MTLPEPVVIVFENGPGRHELRGTAPPGVNVEIEGDGLVIAVAAPRADGTWSVEVGDEPDGEVLVWYRGRATDERGPTAHVFIDSMPPPVGEVVISPVQPFVLDGPVVFPAGPPGEPQPPQPAPTFEFPRDASAEVRGELTGEDALRFGDAPEAPRTPAATGAGTEGATPTSVAGMSTGEPPLDADAAPMTGAELERHARLLGELRLEPPPPDGGGLTDDDRRRVAREVMEPSERDALDPPFARPGHLEIDPDAARSTGDAGGQKPDLILSYTLPDDIRATDLAPRGPDDVPMYSGGSSRVLRGVDTEGSGWFTIPGGMTWPRVVLALIAFSLATLGVCAYDPVQRQFVLNPPPPIATPVQTSEALPTTVARNPADIGVRCHLPRLPRRVRPPRPRQPRRRPSPRRRRLPRRRTARRRCACCSRRLRRR